jgi:RNA polymerase sigma-70 factor, ECF subfamily
MDESVLILETQHGELEAFNHLVLVYQDSLFNTALRILGDDELAADAMQDTFILAFRHINSFRGGSFKAWLTRTIINVCYDELRRQKRHPTAQLEPANDDDEEIETPRWLADVSMLPEEKIEAAELEQAIQKCLDALPIHFRTVVVLVDVQGMNYSEVASIVRVPLGTIKSRLSRARLRLRESLRVFYEFLPASLARRRKESHATAPIPPTQNRPSPSNPRETDL